MSISQVISLLSGIALFLFGMSLMGDGLKKVAGSKLELILYRLSGTPLRGLLLGTGVTAVIQSSAATSVMVVGFVNSGMMKVRQAISVILGSILGTSITGWVISLSYLKGSSGVLSLLSTSTLTGVVAVVGIVLRTFTKSQIKHHIGDIMMGFSVLMFGMSTMSGAVSDLGKQSWFTDLLSSLSNPFLGILAGAVFTAVLQSASAAVGIVQALSVTGAMQLGSALPLLMGISIGAAAPVLLSALGANTDGKRSAMVYLVAEVVSVMITAAIFYLGDAIFRFSFLDTIMDPFSMALVNTILRLVMVLLLFPFIDLLESLVALLVPSKPNEEEVLTFRLEDRFLGHPAVAVEQCRQTINEMAAACQESMQIAVSLLSEFDAKAFSRVEKLEKDVDRYEDALGSYLVKLTGRELPKALNREISKYLHSLSDLERISDHALTIAHSAKEIREKQIHFSGEARHELEVITAAVEEIIRLTVSAFTQEDLRQAVRVEPLEELIDELCDAMKLNHVERLQQGSCTIAQGFVFNDLLTSFERVGDHCSNVAVAMIELEENSFDTHEYMAELKNQRSPSFIRTFREYQKQFTI